MNQLNYSCITLFSVNFGILFIRELYNPSVVSEIFKFNINWVSNNSLLLTCFNTGSKVSLACLFSNRKANAKRLFKPNKFKYCI